MVYSPVYNGLLSSASYLHVSQSMPNVIQFLQSLPFVPVRNTVGTIVTAGLNEQRRNDLGATPFGERIGGRLMDSSSTTYSLQAYTDSVITSGVDMVNATTYQGGTELDYLTGGATASAERVAQKVLKAFADEFMNEANYASGSKTDPTNWTISTTDLVAQVRAKVLEVFKVSGQVPDTIVVTPDVHYVIQNNVDVREGLMSYGASTSLGEGYQAPPLSVALARVFGVNRYHVLDASYNSAALGATASNGYVVTNKLLIGSFGAATRTGNGARYSGGLGLGVYMDYSSLLGSDAGSIANRLGSFPFPLFTRHTVESEYAGGGQHQVITETALDFKLLEPLFGHLFYGAIA